MTITKNNPICVSGDSDALSGFCYCGSPFEQVGEYRTRIFDTGSETNNLGSGAYLSLFIDKPSGSYTTGDGTLVTYTTRVLIQTRTASTQAGVESAVWGANDGSGSWESGASYEDDGEFVKIDPSATGKRYLQARFLIETTDGKYTPIIDFVNIVNTTGTGISGVIDLSADLCGAVDFEGDVRNFVSASLKFSLNNTDQNYSYGKDKYALLEKGNLVKFYWGIAVAGEVYYQELFTGVIESRPNQGAIMQISCLDKNSQLTSFSCPIGLFGSVYAWRAIQDIYEALSFSPFDFDTTILTKLPVGRWFTSESTADEAIQKLLEVICARLWITPDGTIKLAQRPSTATPAFTFSDSNTLINSASITPYENLLARVSVVNSEDTITENPETIVGTDSGSLLASEQTKTITINFTQAPIWKVRHKNTGTGSSAQLAVSCGYYGSNGNVQITVTNPNYPQAGCTYALTIYGRVLSTTDASIKFAEKTNQDLWDKKKGQDVTIRNRFLLGQTEVTFVADTQMLNYGQLLNKVNIKTEFIPFLEYSDAVKITNVLTNLSNVYYITKMKHSANLESGCWTSDFELDDSGVAIGSVLYDTVGVDYDSGFIYDYYS